MSPAARAVALVVLLAGTGARADAGWLTSRGRVQPQSRLEAWGGPHSFGAGVLLLDEGRDDRGVGLEVAWVVPDRVAALRLGRTWQLTRVGVAAVSATVGGTGWFVPSPLLDLGAGPQASLGLTLGGEVFSVELGLQSGVEVFVRQEGPRLPQRAQLGFSLRLGHWAVSLLARLGADVLPGRGFVGRGEAVLSLSWFGVARPRADEAPR